MVHGIVSLKCEKGHHLPISYDSNECGCHHKGKACIQIACGGCIKEFLKDFSQRKIGGEVDSFSITIPLDDEGKEIIEKLLKNNVI